MNAYVGKTTLSEIENSDLGALEKASDRWTLTDRGRALIRRARQSMLDDVAQDHGWSREELCVIRELMRQWSK